MPDDPLPLEAALEEDESFIADEIEDVVDAESQGEDDPSITVMDSENIVAETVELEPEAVEVALEGDPDGGNNDPEGGNTNPEGGNTNPEGGNTNPEGGNTNPEGGNTNPEGGNTNPEGGNTGGDGGEQGESGTDIPPVPGPDDIVLTKLAVTSSVKLGAGESFTMGISKAPANTTETLTLSSANDAVAVVNQAGKITAVAPGTTYISAVSTFGLTARCKVVVLKRPSKITLNKSSIRIYNTAKFNIKVKFPKNTYCRYLTFKSSNKKVAKVSSKGKITAVGRGSATITVRTSNGKKAKIRVTVYNDVRKLMLAKPKKDLGIIFMDIGRNDGILLSCGGKYAFIDSGMPGYGIQARDFMKSMGIKRLKYYIGTHAHADHVAGAANILNSIRVDTIVVPHGGVLSTIRRYGGSSAINRSKVRVLRYGQSIKLGKAVLRCVGPYRLRSASARSTKENRNSLILRVTYGKRSVLLTGDATGEELWDTYSRNSRLLKVDVLKNPHHNGNLKNTYNWFNMKYTIISTANYAQPSSNMISRIRGVGSKYYITSGNRNSHVMMRTDGKTIKFYTTY